MISECGEFNNKDVLFFNKISDWKWDTEMFQMNRPFYF